MRARLHVLGLLAALALAACVGLSPLDRASLEDATRLNRTAYEHSDGGPERALERAAYCATAAVLRRNGGPDAGPIGCDP